MNATEIKALSNKEQAKMLLDMYRTKTHQNPENHAVRKLLTRAKRTWSEEEKEDYNAAGDALKWGNS